MFPLRIWVSGIQIPTFHMFIFSRTWCSKVVTSSKSGSYRLWWSGILLMRGGQAFFCRFCHLVNGGLFTKFYNYSGGSKHSNSESIKNLNIIKFGFWMFGILMAFGCLKWRPFCSDFEWSGQKMVISLDYLIIKIKYRWNLCGKFHIPLQWCEPW